MLKNPDFRQALLKSINIDGRPTSDYDLNKDVQLPENRKLRQAAVLIGLQRINSEYHVVLTKRSSAMKHHPGQIAFPGGKRDDGDKTLTHTALREAFEEIALPQDNVDVIGVLPPHETVTGFQVTPVLGLIHRIYDPIAEIGEVDEIFSVPLAYVTDIQNFRIEAREWRGQMRHYYCVPYGPYYIWGATARILRALADRL
ncbi:CoA pyrophosphatase [Sulfitobacter sp. 1151]|uniref:CoA pyrophosphatase n=2 Tax=Parasulfitobacter algicola TaxID=2614809 RepID=A0ABX2IT78_9RHOB|nr:CoA pyrophosphatase [Sulfitobacter algicola]NSX53559.1 CoA pyrophosphatase [Sulfitobacter algicola]